MLHKKETWNINEECLIEISHYWSQVRINEEGCRGSVENLSIPKAGVRLRTCYPCQTLLLVVAYLRFHKLPRYCLKTLNEEVLFVYFEFFC